MGICSDEVVLIGGGGHAVVVRAAAQRAGLSIFGFLDDHQHAAIGTGEGATPWLGKLHAVSALEGWQGHLAVGDLKLRREVLNTLHTHERTLITIVDPQSVVVESASIGIGSFVAAGAIIQALAQVGSSCIINTGAIVEHECELDENVHVAPGAVLAGRVRVGRNTLIGLGSRVLPGISIGHGCVIGAGAVVTRDVPDRARAVGIPARF